MNKNGISVCQKGTENYEYFTPIHRPKQTFVMYDYRDESGKLFSCVKSTLQECRESRDKWIKDNINNKNV